ncbi:MAG TPA: acetyl-CoA carboxylase biotin carboxyl carrier protein [bacterium]
MDFKDLLKIIAMMKDTDIEEIEFSPEKIRVKRTVRLPGEVGQSIMAINDKEQKKNLDAEAKNLKESKNLYALNSPFVGTFYMAPSPDAAPFVNTGGIVKKGQTLCIVEAMKLMNEIEAEISGKVVQILKNNGEAVEFGEPLFLIEPAEEIE